MSRLTEKLLGYLNRVFDKDPKRFVAMRLHYNGGMSWKVEGYQLTTSVTDGTGENLSIDLTEHTLGTLAEFIASQSGYTVVDLDAGRANLSARVLLEGADGPALFGYTSLIWAFYEAVGDQLRIARDQLQEALNQLEIPKAGGSWLDEWGSYLKVPRQDGEDDANYGPRIIAEVLRPRSNNIAIEQVIEAYTGTSCTVTDVVVYGDVFPLHNSAIDYDGTYNYDVTTPPIFGLFDVMVAYDLINGGDISAFQAQVERLIDISRAAGTHLRALALVAGNIDEPFNLASVDDSMESLTATPLLADTQAAPSEGLGAEGRMGAMVETAAAADDATSTLVYANFQKWDGTRTFNGSVRWIGGYQVTETLDGVVLTTEPLP